ncbi:MAG: hypothetical protein GPOALKHO_000965 [Sodalis sp.]|nr:MAG: hypothetical protein GPOALKHO_000965 [Sodalis sp.]
MVNKLYAVTSEGNVRYKYHTLAGISCRQGENGNKQLKSYQSVCNMQSTFRTTNDKTTSAMDSVLANAIDDMAIMQVTRKPSMPMTSVRLATLNPTSFPHFAVPLFQFATDAHPSHASGLDNGKPG